ncbi:hypothetical protein AGR3A_Cc160071 [Agrobacterium tomkonis CFBP 6623]|uniref:Uncharacterized protein n=1 Tax=Agrobacterium tomkonis CFBP 6623 TaxID=1183432 RepID=A0A1S7NSD2_9HYPH|nr:hypothetical protein AGR3A_Cc160071 [Agrobacterium tomkonis CFBP 6623]
MSALAADYRAATLIGEDDAVTAPTVEACNHNAARRHINNAGTAKTHAACLFFRKARRATKARAIGTTPAAASVMAIAILNLNSELNIRASRSRRSGGGDAAEGNESGKAGFCEGVEHELTPFVLRRQGTSLSD